MSWALGHPVELEARLEHLPQHQERGVTRIPPTQQLATARGTPDHGSATSRLLPSQGPCIPPCHHVQWVRARRKANLVSLMVTAVLSVTEVKDRLLIQILRMPTKRSVVRTLEDRQDKEIPGGESGLPPSEKRAAWA